ncbi:hypothetical protein, partial [Legionella taurinensis]|uniref:hypothetical protein n=1 Tax=Legionella taurinensis TaxID=70611 RepID=UPI001C7DBA2B
RVGVAGRRRETGGPRGSMEQPQHDQDPCARTTNKGLRKPWTVIRDYGVHGNGKRARGSRRKRKEARGRKGGEEGRKKKKKRELGGRERWEKEKEIRNGENNLKCTKLPDKA